MLQCALIYIRLLVYLFVGFHSRASIRWCTSLHPFVWVFYASILISIQSNKKLWQGITVLQAFGLISYISSQFANAITLIQLFVTLCLGACKRYEVLSKTNVHVTFTFCLCYRCTTHHTFAHHSIRFVAIIHSYCHFFLHFGLIQADMSMIASAFSHVHFQF